MAIINGIPFNLTVPVSVANGGSGKTTAIEASSVFVNTPVGMSPGEVRNLSWTKSAGVITIAAADGTALSASNPGYVCIPSTVVAGGHVVLPVTANVTFNDDDHASSHLAGWTFGVTTGVAWNTAMPVFIYALNKDDTAAGLVFGISRSPRHGRFVTADIGDKDAVAGTPGQSNIFIAASITEADYNLVPAQLVGATTMTKVAAADDWTIAATAAYYGLGPQALRIVFVGSYTMPVGQNGANAAGHFRDNGGTAPIWGSETLTYTLDDKGYTNLEFYFTTNDPGGAGAVALLMSGPYASITNSRASNIVALAYGAGPTSMYNARIYTNSLSTAISFSTATTDLTNGDFTTNGNIIVGSLRYKAF